MRRHGSRLKQVALWLGGFVAMLLTAAAASAEPRVALVVGNSNYGGDLGVLPNPVNDAKLIAGTLRKVGFDVVEIEDGDQQALKKAIVDFGDKLSTAGAGATGLFYYAGHGIQSDGENYLIPVHAQLRSERDLDAEAVPIDLVIKQMDFAGTSVNIIILDACRNNPLPKSGRDATRGLAEIKLKPIGSFISFSTAPGDVAQDGNGTDSPYSAALAEAMLVPGLDLADVFRKVRKEVLKATNQKQVPWDSWSLTDPYYFVPPSASPQALAGPSPTLNPPEGGGGTQQQQVAAADPKATWEDIKDSDDPAVFQSYLEAFPNGVYAALARSRLKALGAGDQSTQVAEKDRTVPVQTASSDTGAVNFTAVDRDVYTRDKTTLYAAPADTADIIAKTAPGLSVHASGRSPDGAWWQLLLPNGRTAYAKDTELDQQPPQQTAQADTAGADQSASTADQPPQDPVAKQYFDLGQALYDQGDFKGAHDAFDKAAARNPKDAQALLRRGQATLQLGDADAALKDFDLAIAADPNALEAHGMRILAKLETGDAAGAADEADQVQQIEPTFWSINAIAAYYLAGKLPEAQAMAERVLQDAPDDARSWIWQSIVFKAQGRDGEAADLLQNNIDNIGNRDWPVPVIEWMQGKRTPERLMVAAKEGGPTDQLRQICEVDFYLGEAAYANGDRAGAQKYLGQAVDAKAPDLLAYAAAKALLAKMARE